MALNRRELLVGALAGGVIMRGMAARSFQSPSRTAVSFDVPPGACDCHVHIHGDPAKFPLFAGRVYTPPVALPEELAALHRDLHIQRVVIVTPSIYGTDNAATVYGIRARGRDARGVAVIDAKTTDRELDDLGRAGICGVRLNLATAGISDPTVGRTLFDGMVGRVKPRAWHLQMNTSLAMIAALKDTVANCPVPVVFDHFGNAQAAMGTTQPGFAALLELVKAGKAYVKISAAYRASTLPDYADVAPLARALIAANPDRILWGSDWPHPNPVTLPGKQVADVTPFLQVDDGRVLNLLSAWTADAATRRKILADNPARLYRF